MSAYNHTKIILHLALAKLASYTHILRKWSSKGMTGKKTKNEARLYNSKLMEYKVTHYHPISLHPSIH